MLLRSASNSVGGTLAAALAATIAIGCGSEATSNAPGAAPQAAFVETAPVTTEDIEVAVEAVGTIRARRRVEIRAKSESTVTDVLVRDGQRVALDDNLILLDTTKLDAEVRVHEANLQAARVRAASARTALARAQNLLKRGFIPAQEFDDAQARADEAAAQVSEAEAALALSRELLREANVRAPIPGVVLETKVDPGDFLRMGDHIVTILDENPVEVEFAVPEEHIGQLTLGRPVAVTVPSYPGETFTGTLSYIEPEVLPESRSVRLKASIPNNNHRLRPGQFASVRAVLALHKQATLLPEEAIVPEGTVSWAYVVEDGHAVRRQVTLGVRRAGLVEVTTGLDGSETVVVSGQLRLQDRTPVETAPAPETEG